VHAHPVVGQQQISHPKHQKFFHAMLSRSSAAESRRVALFIRLQKKGPVARPFMIQLKLISQR
jgi:hypothetical protein